MLNRKLKVLNDLVESLFSIQTLTIEDVLICWLEIFRSPRNVSVSLESVESLVCSPELSYTFIMLVYIFRDIATVLNHSFEHEVDAAKPCP